MSLVIVPECSFAIRTLPHDLDLHENTRPPNLLFWRSYLAAGLGFEPRQTDPESVVLPLHNPAKAGFSASREDSNIERK